MHAHHRGASSSWLELARSAEQVPGPVIAQYQPELAHPGLPWPGLSPVLAQAGSGWYWAEPDLAPYRRLD